jgi:UDP-N-acetylglucosamine:LPS N-acetylglucosamine transferase
MKILYKALESERDEQVLTIKKLMISGGGQGVDKQLNDQIDDVSCMHACELIILVSNLIQILSYRTPGNLLTLKMVSETLKCPDLVLDW